MYNRTSYLKGSLFPEVTSLISSIKETNENLLKNDGFIAPKSSTAKGLFARTFGNIVGCKEFPIRPLKAIATDGTILWVNYPSENGAARGYIRPSDSLPDEVLQNTVFMLKKYEPDCPYYLRMKQNNYFVYTPAPALVERAQKYFRSDDEHSKCLAFADMRFAICINSIFNKSNVIEKLQKFENEIIGTWKPNYFWEKYKELVTQSRAYANISNN